MTNVVKVLGQYMLDHGCPENDCVIYKNIYKMYCEVKEDLARCVVSDTSTMYLNQAEHRLFSELSEMYYSNYAVQMFRRSLTKEGMNKNA